MGSFGSATNLICITLERMLQKNTCTRFCTKHVTPEEATGVADLAAALERERSSPHRLRDLAIDGTDLIAAGLAEGPELGRVLDVLLSEVVDDPARNDRATLLARAREVIA